MVDGGQTTTRLETLTKEFNICATSRVREPARMMKVPAGIVAPATDHSIGKGLMSMSTSVRAPCQFRTCTI